MWEELLCAKFLEDALSGVVMADLLQRIHLAQEG